MNVYLSIGSNVGDRVLYLNEAVTALWHLARTSIRKVSSIYETEPWGNKNQPSFLNLSIALETELSPEELLENCQKIEMQLGRNRKQKWEPRPIDIDILLYGEEMIQTPTLQIPHINLTDRRFVLEPLAEIAPDVRVPPSFSTVSMLLEQCPDQSWVVHYIPEKR